MIVFSIASIVFLLVVVMVLAAQRRNDKRVREVSERFSQTLDDVVPRVQKQHTLQFGRASTALESVTIPPKTKSHPA